MRDIGDIKGDSGRQWETIRDNGRQKGDTGEIGEIKGDIQRHTWRHWEMMGDTRAGVFLYWDT